MTARTWTSPRRIVMGERPARMTAPSVYPRSWQSCRCTSVSWHLASLTEKPCWVAGANCRQIKPRSSRLVASRIHTSSRRDALSDTRILTRSYTDSHTHSLLLLRVVIIHGNRLLAYCRQISNVTLPMFYFKVSTVKRIDIWHIYAVWQGRRSGYESGGDGIHVNPERSFGGTNGEPPSEASQLRKGGPGVVPRKISKTYMANGAIYVIPELYLWILLAYIVIKRA